MYIEHRLPLHISSTFNIYHYRKSFKFLKKSSNRFVSFKECDNTQNSMEKSSLMTDLKWPVNVFPHFLSQEKFIKQNIIMYNSHFFIKKKHIAEKYIFILCCISSKVIYMTTVCCGQETSFCTQTATMMMTTAAKVIYLLSFSMYFFFQKKNNTKKQRYWKCLIWSRAYS